MKTVFIGFIVWIIFQLISIGISGVDIYNQMVKKTYVCDTKETIPVLMGVVLPLALFVPETSGGKYYCSLQDNPNK